MKLIELLNATARALAAGTSPDAEVQFESREPDNKIVIGALGVERLWFWGPSIVPVLEVESSAANLQS